METMAKSGRDIGTDSDKWFNTFADAMPCINWIARADGAFERFNTRWYEVTGVSEELSCVESWNAAVHPEDRDKFINAWRQSIQNLQPFKFEFRLWFDSHKQHRWQLGRAQPLPNHSGEVFRWVGSCQDIHDQRVFEDLFRTTEARLKGVVEECPVGVILLNRQGDPVYYNRKCAELRGNEVDLMAWANALHPDDRERVISSTTTAIERGIPSNEKYRYMHSNGGTVWVRARTAPIRSGSELLGFVRTLEDITDLKLAEENLQTANQQLRLHAGSLEEAVYQRTQEMRQALAELDKLSYSIVHDMRAPLRGMQAFSHLLTQDYADKLDDHGRELLEKIKTAALRQDRLIQDVLAYHNYARNEFPLAPVDLDQIVTEIMETYANLQPSKISIRVERPLGWVMAHDTLLIQCISALLNNAAKFVAPGLKSEIVLRTEDDAGEIVLWVEDQGIGIAPQYHQKIFDIFQILNPRTYPGTGIGLPLTKKAVERMHGRVGVESEAGHGARFWIALPKAPDF
jgi:PAS domain S-box-containing protein